jgi:hypothetical protein
MILSDQKFLLSMFADFPKSKLNSHMIWKKSKLKSEKIWEIQKKGKLNSEKDMENTEEK